MISNSVSRFWDKYIIKTKAYGIKGSAVRWYVRHAEDYIKSYPGIRLAQHSKQDVDKFFEEKGRNPRITDWQFKQVIVAVKLLFTEMVILPWSNEYPWNDWLDRADSINTNHDTVARDFIEIDIESIKQGVLAKNQNENSLFSRVFAAYPEYIMDMIKCIRLKHYSIRTEHAYLGWLLRFINYHNLEDSVSFSESHITKYLEHLVIKRKVSSSTQGQALNALVFFYKNVLQKDVSEQIDFVRSKKPKRLPVVLTTGEIKSLFSHIHGRPQHLMVRLLYGCGMRLMECVRLRILDVDFEYQQIIVREAKGKKDRVVPIPRSVFEDLQQQVEFVKIEHKNDLAQGYGKVYMPVALSRKYPNAESEFRWQYV
ncbi:MAG: integron integrase, partial [Gammaproteobacteria bacterium]|nr:integron integrase [Gammaproteobacteria bacterium]